MIELKLKRIKGNNSVQHGRLVIPQLNFKCVTLELAPSNDSIYKHNCAIPLGTYQLVAGFAQLEPYYPIFKKKPVGFAKRPELMCNVSDYMHLPTGCIALGTKQTGTYSIEVSRKLEDTFKNLMREALISKEICVLEVYKSEHYTFDECSYETDMKELSEYNFIEEDEPNDSEEQIELDNNGGD